MVSGAILSGAISALLGSVFGAALTHYRNTVVSEASSIQALHAELCENRDRLDDEIQRIRGIENIQSLRSGFSFESYSEVRRNEPEVFNRLASGYTEVLVAYRSLERLQEIHEASMQPNTGIEPDGEELIKILEVNREKAEQGVESVNRLWRENKIRTVLFADELEDPYGGFRLIRYTERMGEMMANTHRISTDDSSQN